MFIEKTEVYDLGESDSVIDELGEKSLIFLQQDISFTENDPTFDGFLLTTRGIYCLAFPSLLMVSQSDN